MKARPMMPGWSFHPKPGRATSAVAAARPAVCRRFTAFASLLAITTVSSVSPASAAKDGVEIVKPWMRFIIAVRPAAGYFTLDNMSDSARVLTGAASPVCGRIMLHRSITKNGSNAMVHVGSVTVAAHGSIDFSPGGYHLMCMKPAKDFGKRSTVPVTLSFKDGRSVSADFVVRGATSK